MNAEDFKARVCAVKVEETKVTNKKKTFTGQTVKHLDLDKYESRLKEIRNDLDSYNNVINELILDLTEIDRVDQQRRTDLEREQETLLQEILANEKEVKEKVRDLLLTRNLRLEQRKIYISLKAKQMDIDAEKKRKSKEDQAKKIEVDEKDVLDIRLSL